MDVGAATDHGFHPVVHVLRVLIARNSIDNADRSRRLAAILAIVGALDVPLVIMATRLFRGMHPVSPTMVPSMRVVLWLSIVSFTLFFCWLTAHRRIQIRQQEQLARLESQAESGDQGPLSGMVLQVFRQTES